MKSFSFRILLFTGIFLVLTVNAANAQVKIGNNPTTIGASSLLELESINKGMVLPRLTGAQMNAIPSPVQGMMIFNTDSVCICQYSGSYWFSLCGTGIIGKPNFWDLKGNSGTVDGTNFLGTTDNMVMNFRVNNQKAGRIDHLLNNVFLGYQSGNSNTGISNTFIGHRAGYSNSTANQNTFIGDSAGYSITSGIKVTAIGYKALANNNYVTGSNYNSNTAVGALSMFNNTTGFDNAAFGYGALYSGAGGSGWNNVSIGNLTLLSNLDGHDNTAVGYNAMSANTSGLKNTAIGYQAMQANTSGNSNVTLGNLSLTANTTGSNNTSIGNNSGWANTTGSYNTFLGDGSNAGSGALTNATAIGKSAIVGASNSLVLGGTGANAVLAGTNTTTPNSRFQVKGSFATTVTAIGDADYTITVDDQVITGNPLAADRTFTLPDATTIKGRIYTIKKISPGGKKVLLAGFSGQVIDGNTSPYDKLSGQWDTVTIVSDGANWLIISKF